jgi:CHAD domain-containing protein
MLKDSVLSYFKTNADIFIRTYGIASKNADIDAVHDLRVSLKRIDTLIRMLNFNKKANYRLKNCYKPLQKLFKLAGNLRDFQVQVLLIEEMKQNVFIDEIIQKKFNLRKDYFEKKFNNRNGSFNFLLIKRNFHLAEYYIFNVSEQELKKQIASYQKSRITLLEEYSSKEKKSFNLHSARKMIKDLSYLIEMSGSGNFNEDSKFLQYKETGHFLGDLHDNVVMLEYLEEILFEDSQFISDNSDNLRVKLQEKKQMLTDNYLEKYKEWKNE